MSFVWIPDTVLLHHLTRDPSNVFASRHIVTRRRALHDRDVPDFQQLVSYHVSSLCLSQK